MVGHRLDAKSLRSVFRSLRSVWSHRYTSNVDGTYKLPDVTVAVRWSAASARGTGGSRQSPVNVPVGAIAAMMGNIVELRALLAACNVQVRIISCESRRACAGDPNQGRVVGLRDDWEEIPPITLATVVVNTDVPHADLHVIVPSLETSNESPMMSLTYMALVHKLWQRMAAVLSYALDMALMPRKNVPGRIGDPLMR